MTQKAKQKTDGENKKEAETATATTVVLKVDMHCDGCASKIVKCIRGFQGVESLKAESESGKLTITGKVDPSKLREKLSAKMKKQVDLISPLPNNKPKINKPQDKNNKPKLEEPPVNTAVLRVSMHCQGCIERIRKTVLKTKGVYEMAIDKEKETVTVKGTMDEKLLAANLTDRLKRKVEVVPPKKEKEKDKEKDKDKDKEKGKGKESEKEGGGGASEKGGNAGGKKKKEKEKEDGGGDGQGKTEQNKMEVLAPAFGYPYGYGYGYGYDGYNYGPVYMGQLHAPQMFSDENPNACSLM